MLRNGAPTGGTVGGNQGALSLADGQSSVPILPGLERFVNRHDQRLLLARQARAAEERATAAAEWHWERAARYLGWIDLPWAAARYTYHINAAAFQVRLADRHHAIFASLTGEVES